MISVFRRLSTLLLVLAVGCSNGQSENDPQHGADEDSDRPGVMGGRDMMGDEGMRGDGMMDDGMTEDGMRADSMPRWMMSAGGMGGMMQEMRVIRSLLIRHERIEREVEDVPGGVRTTTTSEDPETAEMIRRHVRQMKDRMQEGRPIRRMDPLFRELFEHHEEIELEYEDIPDGIRVRETSENPEVVSLIRQHAHAFVNEVVEHGMRRAMQPTPLPDEYRP